VTPERWQQIDRLLELALDQKSNERADSLEKACAGDEELHREVEALLVAHRQAGSFIEAPALGVAAQAGKQHDSLAGQKLGHYEVLSRLGEGGMGVVYKACDKYLDRTAAIKTLPRELVSDPERKRRFVQEAKSASALNHPNIITIYEIGNENGLNFIAMEYLPGKTLEQVIPRRGMPLKQSLKIATQIAVSRGIYFMTAATDHFTIQFFSFATSKITPVAPIERIPMWGFSVFLRMSAGSYTHRSMSGAQI
jgi:hypothetical protein